MRKLAILSGLAAVIGAAGFAQADVRRPCLTNGASSYLTVDAFLAKMIDQGYKIRSLETKNGCGKVHAINKSGVEAELLVDLTAGAPATGND